MLELEPFSVFQLQACYVERLSYQTPTWGMGWGISQCMCQDQSTLSTPSYHN